jgi:hypothetical protein
MRINRLGESVSSLIVGRFVLKFLKVTAYLTPQKYEEFHREGRRKSLAHHFEVLAHCARRVTRP